MSYGFQPPPPYQGGQPGQPGQPGFPSAPPPYQALQSGQPPYQPLQSGQPPYQPAAPGARTAVIRHLTTGLCLDATEYDVKLQYYNGNPAQLWTVEPVGGNKYIFRCRANGAVLDIEGGPDCGAQLITYEGHGGINQQWFVNPDNTITSAAADIAVDIYEGNCFPGQVLIAYDRHGGPNQQFNLQYQ